MPEQDFMFFLNQWRQYLRVMEVEGQALVHKLYSTMSPELRELVYNQARIEQLDTQELMMERIKLLAV